ncbi:LpqB family beta-propeller domain-containing protein [Catenuloplanes sp. NPDC051500]|uniref:LpqB family beta-propeller domain-containing protein n=1 Tax=Catenuloplanes sp. NPDC051500 TaxID=3363959 RepID=UPI00378E3BEE
MKRLSAAAMTFLVVAALTGCGIPGSTDVQVRGGMPSPEVGGGNDTIPAVNRANASTGTARELVNSFLRAPAGDPEQAVERARSFIAPSRRDDWKPSGEINIVHLEEEPNITSVDSSSSSVVLKVRHLGVLTANGSVDPPNNEETEYPLTVGEVPGQEGYWVTSAQPLLLLPDQELTRYEPTSVYFWNKDRTALVPDLRWLPRSISAERRPTELLEWLSGGPSALISQAVDGLPANVKQKGNVPKVGADRALEVNLSAEAGALDEEALNRLGAQLWWTLREHLSGGDLLVKVEGQLRKTFTGDEALLAANPSTELQSPPDRFAIYDGTIKRLRDPNQTLPPVPLVAPDTNTGVSVASFSRLGTRIFGAWVRDRGGNDGQELVISAEVPGMPLRIPIGDGAAGRPAWLWAPDAMADADAANMVGLIVIGGKLQQFGTQDTNRTTVAVSGLPGQITSMAVAHDGQRIALVSGGRLFVTALIRTDTSVKVSTVVREVHTSLHDITAVDFAGQDQLLVAGQQPQTNRVGVVQVTLDGAQEAPRATDLGSAQVTSLAAYPVNPVSTNSAGSEAAYVANNIAYRLLLNSSRIETTQLLDPPPDAVSNKITAPFFLE